MEGARKPVMHRRRGASSSRDKRPERYLMPSGRGKNRSVVFDDTGTRRRSRLKEQDTLEKRMDSRKKKLRRFSKTQQAVYSYFLVALLVHSMVLVVGMFAFAGADIAYTLLSFRFSLWGLRNLLAWVLVMLVHYFITYGVFVSFDIPTNDLDEYADYFMTRVVMLVKAPFKANIVPRLEDHEYYEEE